MANLATLYANAMRRMNAPLARKYATRLGDAIGTNDRNAFRNLLADEKSLRIMMNDFDLGESVSAYMGTGYVNDVTRAIVTGLFNRGKPKLGLEFYNDFMDALEKMFPPKEMGKPDTNYWPKYNYINLYPIFLGANFTGLDTKKMPKGDGLLKDTLVRRMKLVDQACIENVELSRGHPLERRTGAGAMFNRDFVIAYAEFFATGRGSWKNKRAFLQALVNFPNPIVLDALAIMGKNPILAAEVAGNLLDYLRDKKPKLSPVEQRLVVKMMRTVPPKKDKSNVWKGWLNDIALFMKQHTR